MSNTLPKVSIIIPIFNEERWIINSLNSIQNQTYKNIEIIVVDDYSTDNSLKITEQLAKTDDRIKIITKKNEPKGPGVSRNIAFKKATGDYIAFQDADDYSEPDRIEKQMDLALVKPGKRMVGCSIKVINDTGEFLKTLPENHHEIIKGFSKFRNRGGYFVMGTALGPKQFFLNNPCKEIIRYVTDWDQLLRIYENEDVEFCNTQENLYHYNYIGGLSTIKNGWIDSNLFVRFSQRMRKKKLVDPLTLEQLFRYLRNNPKDFLLYHLLKGYYQIRKKLGK